MAWQARHFRTVSRPKPKLQVSTKVALALAWQFPAVGGGASEAETTAVHAGRLRYGVAGAALVAQSGEACPKLKPQQPLIKAALALAWQARLFGSVGGRNRGGRYNCPSGQPLLWRGRRGTFAQSGEARRRPKPQASNKAALALAPQAWHFATAIRPHSGVTGVALSRSRQRRVRGCNHNFP